MNTYDFNTDDNRKLLLENDKCDKYDYLAAVACGAVGGLIDIFLVGAPGDSKLGSWTDKQIDNAVKSFSKRLGWKARNQDDENVSNAIRYLEHKFKVNYDQQIPSAVDNQFNMSASTHHMMSLAHSPDIIGLFFSILNQFTSTASFVVEGQMIMVRTDTFELQGSNLITKVLCGIANWFGHLMSDVAGTSTAHGRGMGIVMPFYEIFGFCKFGKFETKNGTKDLSEIAMQAFTEGYDFRFGLAMAIPVVVTDLTIKLVWGLRRHFQYEYSIKECLPTSKHATLRVMLLVGNGTLCAMDAIDAGIRAGGDPVKFILRMNLIAWYRFVTLVVKEVLIRVGISSPLQSTIDAYKRTNEALRAYLSELEKIDIEQFKIETEKYNKLQDILSKPVSEQEYSSMLLDYYTENGLTLPWEGDFDTFMGERTNKLVFE